MKRPAVRLRRTFQLSSVTPTTHRPTRLPVRQCCANSLDLGAQSVTTSRVSIGRTKHRARRRLDHDPPAPSLSADEPNGHAHAVALDLARLALGIPVDALAGRCLRRRVGAMHPRLPQLGPSPESRPGRPQAAAAKHRLLRPVRHWPIGMSRYRPLRGPAQRSNRHASCLLLPQPLHRGRIQREVHRILQRADCEILVSPFRHR